ncbi:hypothetical protein [Methylogaea oryzae]|uniref:Uncharacterized protein n=1 Tax=Methylogaea oryzae TaxID=1295382 RepID=A0A8D5AIA0_9GAMM|nr:hypothetical protein [Methylogaea oryzae]BBL71126.1 hypothetical protein MoryE10_17320 [Methylogaea oryzae]
MKVFLCRKQLGLTTMSWCLRKCQSPEGGASYCSGCPVLSAGATPRLYSIDELCCTEMLEEYKQMANAKDEMTSGFAVGC